MDPTPSLSTQGSRFGKGSPSVSSAVRAGWGAALSHLLRHASSLVYVLCAGLRGQICIGLGEGDDNHGMGCTAAAVAVLWRRETTGYVGLGFEDCLYMSAGIGLRAGYPLQ